MLISENRLWFKVDHCTMNHDQGLLDDETVARLQNRRKGTDTSVASADFSDARDSERASSEDLDVERMLSRESIRAALIKARQVQTAEQYERTSQAIREALGNIKDHGNPNQAACMLNDAFNAHGVQVSATTVHYDENGDEIADVADSNYKQWPLTHEQIVAKLNFI